MFHDWKVGKQGWVRLRNGKVARAIQFCDGSLPVQIQYLVGQILAMHWVDNSGSLLGGKSDYEPIEHLFDCTGFDWKPATVKWSEGDYSMQESVGSVIHDISANPREPKLEVFHQEWKAVDWRPCDPPKGKFKVGDWVRIISHEGWCKDAKKDHPIGSYRKIASVARARQLKLETASFWKFFRLDHVEPFVYRAGDWVKVTSLTSHLSEHSLGAIRRIRVIEQRGWGKFFLFDGFNYGLFETDVIPTHSPIEQAPPIIWQLSAKVVVVSR